FAEKGERCGGLWHSGLGRFYSMPSRSRGKLACAVRQGGHTSASSRPKRRDPYAAAYREGTAYGSLLSRGREAFMNLSRQDLEKIADVTLEHYNRNAENFWEGTRDHDVSQNIEALLQHIEGEPPFTVLDFGCGPGRDLK